MTVILTMVAFLYMVVRWFLFLSARLVVRAGLRRINTAYSCISFADIAAKLKLGSAEDAEYVCAKNIRDGVIKAQLDHDVGAMLSRDQADLYSTSEPQQSFHDRISFCLEMHDSAVKVRVMGAHVGGWVGGWVWAWWVWGV
jgi:hypothetical protein